MRTGENVLPSRPQAVLLVETSWIPVRCYGSLKIIVICVSKYSDNLPIKWVAPILLPCVASHGSSFLPTFQHDAFFFTVPKSKSQPILLANLYYFVLINNYKKKWAYDGCQKKLEDGWNYVRQMHQTLVWQKLDMMIGACKIFKNWNYYHINSNCQHLKCP
jgi:hypothetical protein